MKYYIGGFPVTDELYHHGILGQKWGVRRYQNPDGTLTTLGKVRYGAASAGRATGKIIKKAVDHKVDNVKRKHPWMMSDEKLKTQTDRLRLENAYANELSKSQDANTSRGQKLARDILESSAKTFAAKGVEAAAKKLFTEHPKAVRDLEDVLNDPKATIDELKNAKSRYDMAEKLEKDKRLNRNYKDLDKLNLDSMSKNDLDSVNAWLNSRNSNNIKQYEKGQQPKDQKPKDQKPNEERAKDQKPSESKVLDSDRVRRQQIEAQVRLRAQEAQRQREERSNRALEARRTAESNASNRLSAERRREVENMVEGMFKQARINRADRTDSMIAFRRSAEFNAAKRRALQLARDGENVTVQSIFYD